MPLLMVLTFKSLTNENSRQIGEDESLNERHQYFYEVYEH